VIPNAPREQTRSQDRGLASSAQIPKYGQIDVAVTIDVELVTALISEQFPQWSHLPITQVLPGGWGNRTFRIGDELSVRLPSHEGYVLQVEKEQRWLPILAPQLPVPVPEPVGFGQASGAAPLDASRYARFRWRKPDRY
jgi:aminoglycoside phosphotransferase (APT) family kinase protein